MAVGYGDGRVSIGPTTVGRVAVTKVTAVPALTPRIRLDLSWTLGHVASAGDGNPPEAYLLTDFGGELRLGADDRFVGTLVRDRSRHALRSFGYVDTQAGSVALDLGRHGLERMEEHRAGAALELRMQLWTRIEMGGGTTDSRVEGIELKFPRDDWIGVLGVLTGARVDLLEIRYDLVYAAHYRGEPQGDRFCAGSSRPRRLPPRSPASAEGCYPHGGIREGDDRRRSPSRTDG